MESGGIHGTHQILPCGRKIRNTIDQALGRMLVLVPVCTFHILKNSLSFLLMLHHILPPNLEVTSYDISQLLPVGGPCEVLQ